MRGFAVHKRVDIGGGLHIYFSHDEIWKKDPKRVSSRRSFCASSLIRLEADLFCLKVFRQNTLSFTKSLAWIAAPTAV